jgi:hypothetical protein
MEVTFQDAHSGDAIIYAYQGLVPPRNLLARKSKNVELLKGLELGVKVDSVRGVCHKLKLPRDEE